MNHEEIKTKYLEWLMDRAGLEKDGPDGYGDICRQLQETEFVPIIEMDENRCADCSGLRYEFDPEDCYILDMELCDTGTFLELLIVMAEKMKYELSDSMYEASTRKWIMELMGNCGLDMYARNEDYEKRSGRRNVDGIVSAIIFREIGWDGEGGLFPLFLAQRDQRRTELICQMNDYLEENYDIC